MTMFKILQENGGDFTDHDLAVLSDWANDMNRATPNPDWKRAYSLIREGADLLLRRRARSSAGAGQLRYEDEPKGLNHRQRDPAYHAGCEAVDVASDERITASLSNRANDGEILVAKYGHATVSHVQGGTTLIDNCDGTTEAVRP